MKWDNRKPIIICLILLICVFAYSNASSLLPEFYGLYISQGDEVLPLTQGNLVFKTGLTIGNIRTGLYGIPEPPDLRVDQGPIEIIHYHQEIPPSKVRLSSLIFFPSASAHFFDVKKGKTDPPFFQNVYGVGYNQTIPINLWAVDYNIPLDIAPVAEKPGMYRLVPKYDLTGGGIFAVHFGSVEGPTYYVGDLKFFPFALGSAEQIEQMKKTAQQSSSSKMGSPQQIDLFPGCTPRKTPELMGAVSLKEHLSLAYLITIRESNIRQEPNTNSSIIAIVSSGTRLEKVNDVGDWFNVKIASGKAGYIYKSLVKEKE